MIILLLRLHEYTYNCALINFYYRAKKTGATERARRQGVIAAYLNVIAIVVALVVACLVMGLTLGLYP